MHLKFSSLHLHVHMSLSLCVGLICILGMCCMCSCTSISFTMKVTCIGLYLLRSNNPIPPNVWCLWMVLIDGTMPGWPLVVKIDRSFYFLLKRDEMSYSFSMKVTCIGLYLSQSNNPIPPNIWYLWMVLIDGTMPEWPWVVKLDRSFYFLLKCDWISSCPIKKVHDFPF